MSPRPRRRGALRGALRRLDRMLGLDRGGRSEWLWAIPAAVFGVTVGVFLFVGQVTHAEVAVVVPNAVVIALVMGGLAISCMMPSPDDTSSDDPPGGNDPGPVLGLPGGPWLVVAWPTSTPAEPILDGSDARPQRVGIQNRPTVTPNVGVERN